MKRANVEQLVFLLFLLALFGWALWSSLEFPGQAQTYPRTVAGAAVIITMIELVSYIVSWSNETLTEVAPENTLTARFMTILPFLVWLAAYYVVIYVIGMVAASGLFVFLFLYREGKVKWYYALLARVFIILFLVQMEDVMSLRWPDSIIDPIEMMGLH